MAKYPYIPNSGSLKSFISEIPTTGRPSKLTISELVSRGYKSNNDRPIIAVLKFINFIDNNGVPTENWNLYRDKQKNKSVMATAVRSAYSELFNLYPNANEKDTEALRNFFSTRIDGGEQVLAKTVATFKTLCELGDFTGDSVEDIHEEPPATKSAQSVREALQIGNVSDRQLVINLNIQLQLPATDNAEIYDKIFQSLKKNVIEQ